MKVEQLNSHQIDWTKPQVVVNKHGRRVHVVVNDKQDEVHFTGFEIETGNIYCLYQKEQFKPENAKSYPIELKLTIESDKELCDLWNRANINHNDVMHNLSSYLVHDAIYEPSFWKELDKLAKERNLYKND